MDALYSFLLDLFPLTEEISEQNYVLGHRIAEVALDAMFAEEYRPALGRLELLLRLSADLGYLDLDVLGFLLKELHRC